MSLYSCVLISSFFFFKQKTAYEVRISDWSSDVCSSDLPLSGLISFRSTGRYRTAGLTGHRNRQSLSVIFAIDGTAPTRPPDLRCKSDTVAMGITALTCHLGGTILLYLKLVAWAHLPPFCSIFRSNFVARSSRETTDCTEIQGKLRKETE